ncbi:Cytoplasmic protein, partial [Monkeypox virus]
YNPPPK